jgi:hypothetical protein
MSDIGICSVVALSGSMAAAAASDSESSDESVSADAANEDLWLFSGVPVLDVYRRQTTWTTWMGHGAVCVLMYDSAQQGDTEVCDNDDRHAR